jgi:hypothetical protein
MNKIILSSLKFKFIFIWLFSNKTISCKYCNFNVFNVKKCIYQCLLTKNQISYVFWTCNIPKKDVKEGHNFPGTRPRSNTVSEGTTTKISDRKVLPTVFKWEGGGKQVYISGTFNDWKTLPMVKSHGDFVTIIDLPEGEHQYKFFVDGEWRHDPGLVSTDFTNQCMFALS